MSMPSQQMGEEESRASARAGASLPRKKSGLPFFSSRPGSPGCCCSS